MTPEQRERFFCGIRCPTCGATQGDPCTTKDASDWDAPPPSGPAITCRARKVAARKRRFACGRSAAGAL
jgi:hypothetical protein